MHNQLDKIKTAIFSRCFVFIVLMLAAVGAALRFLMAFMTAEHGGKIPSVVFVAIKMLHLLMVRRYQSDDEHMAVDTVYNGRTWSENN